MTAELVKKVTYFGTYLGDFGYLNSSCIRKSIILMFLSSSKDKLTLLLRNSVTDFLLISGRHVRAHPHGHQNGVAIQISINLGKTFFSINCRDPSMRVVPKNLRARALI